MTGQDLSVRKKLRSLGSKQLWRFAEHPTAPSSSPPSILVNVQRCSSFRRKRQVGLVNDGASRSNRGVREAATPVDAPAGSVKPCLGIRSSRLPRPKGDGRRGTRGERGLDECSIPADPWQRLLMRGMRSLRRSDPYPTNVWNGAYGAYWVEVNQWDVEGILVSRFSRSYAAVSIGAVHVAS